MSEGTMMAKETFPRRPHIHEEKAGKVLQRHEAAAGEPVDLPVPVEDIIERTMGLTILYDEIEEPAGTKILGALSPSDRLIVLNERHVDLFEEVVGPEKFTLAHELGHWVYDADDPNQQSFDFTASTDDVFCYHRDGSEKLADTARIREINANGFASCLLMPKHLVSAANIDEVLADFRGTARGWGVSQQALRIRLEKLGLIDERDLHQLNMM